MDGIRWAGSAMAAARARLDIAAENLANASSDGFRRTSARGFMEPGGVRIERQLDGEQGALRHTGRSLDLALIGPGHFTLRSAEGTTERTRSGAFARDRFGRLTDDAGRVVQGRRGALVVPQGATLEPDGSVRQGTRVVDRIALPPGTSLRTGFLESANVNPIAEMIDVLGAQRSFESAQKALTALDETRQKNANEIAKLK